MEDVSIPAHEAVYRGLRRKILLGDLAPGVALTIRGLAEEFHVSMTPAREAARRLAAEGALAISASGRISTPILTERRIEELTTIRTLLEPELAAQALPRAHNSLIERLKGMDSEIEDALGDDDAGRYVRLNMDFHRAVYLRAHAPAVLALVETAWLQMGPSMRRMYSRGGIRRASTRHRAAIAALAAGDEAGLRLAIREDVQSGLKLLSSEMDEM